MNILALEPYYGGSHRAFIDGLSKVSRHNWTVLTLPAHKWKWRMRHSAITFAAQAAQLSKEGRSWEMLFCSDMLNLAEFAALAPAGIAGSPRVIYFHENQLTYPVRVEDERDYQFVMTNLTSALAADAVWFNSQFHMDSFLDALAKFLKSMPDHQPLEAIETIRTKSSGHPPGIADFPPRPARKPGPMRILWAARWEHDKNPEDFFEALGILKTSGVNFKVSVIGQSFRDRPEVFEQAHRHFQDHIELWGYQQSRDDYERVLCRADVIVSTANHEFFGIGVLEAAAAGAYPLVPDRLSYPEILGKGRIEGAGQFFYDGTARDLADKLSQLAARIEKDALWPVTITPAILTDPLKWDNLGRRYDSAFEELAEQKS
ncbi:MAG: tRNA-queuosine alpha-mannosyltransferase domain-containing protein [Planctomycetota bacterium]|jgi:glycosyltransferase involved in cell wall biosynthesis